MQKCNTCEHWVACDESPFRKAGSTGRCYNILSSDLVYIEVKAGWDGGYVDYVETAKSFGCVEHKVK